MADVTLKSRVSIPDVVVSRDLGGETVVLNLETGMYFDLDGVATDAWLAIQQTSSLQDIHGRLLAQYEVDAGVLAADLVRLVEQLATKGLVHVA